MTISFEKFIERIIELDIVDMDHSNRYDLDASWRNPSTKPKRFFIEVTWTTGGMTGGSCWHDYGADTPVSAEPARDLEGLDLILEAFCPAISYLQYKALSANLIKEFTFTNSEYYGNYYTYAGKLLFVDDLYTYLTKNNLI